MAWVAAVVGGEMTLYVHWRRRSMRSWIQTGLVSSVFGVFDGDFEQDTFTTSGGQLKIWFLGHGTLMFDFAGKILQVDPWTKLADYRNMPKADVILITHEHHDHLDPTAVGAASKTDTVTVITEKCLESLEGGEVLRNGESKVVSGMTIEAVAAYNIEHKREGGSPFHPRGEGNGYILTFGNRRVYVAGDTENVPEMKELHDIDIAFLPMNLPYTMTPDMVANAALSFRPKILYPYHFGETNTQELVDKLKGTGIEVRIRRLS
jgi:L-ascorbate metabolism protein UlaG (beta-lactamase superfamily)